MNNKKFHDVHASNEGVFSTISGRKINILKPDPTMICGLDIAAHLSHICRFGGMLNSFYSVAQHSVMVSYLVGEDYALAGLLHDASEAYLGDVIKPLKNVIGKAYTDIEDRFMEVIFDKAGLDTAAMDHIHIADAMALQAEHEAFKKDQPDDFRDICREYRLPMMPLLPQESFLQFGDRLRELLDWNCYEAFWGDLCR